MNTDDILDAVSISALNQYAYCPRRCALILVEQTFVENIHTQRGSAEHDQVDKVEHKTLAEGVRVEYAVPVWSEQLGLTGRCDVVEFHLDGIIYPVEYKHGVRKRWINDDLQLAAQAMCLEEMTGKKIPHGAIYHHSSRRRREVEISKALHDKVVETVTAIRALMISGIVPPPVNDQRCPQCSLVEVCQPAALAAKNKLHLLRESLFKPEDDSCTNF